jgi:pyruvate dehydrogenase E2 component (dihydrolipoamide acetyltransferase)
MEFRLPELGEGIESATVTEVRVKPGDRIAAGQPVLAVETEKAGVEVPAEAEGVVESVQVKPGDKVRVGSVILTFAVSNQPTHRDNQSVQPTPEPAIQPPPTTQSSTQQLKLAEHNQLQQIQTTESGSLGSAAAANSKPVGNGTATKTIIAAGPATRRLARELGISLAEIVGTGRGGRVTLDDVKNFVRSERQRMKEGGVKAPSGSTATVFELPPLPDFSKYGPIEVQNLPTIRQTIAKNLTIGWRTMPMVTQHDLADITELEAGRKRIVEGLPKDAPKITMTALAVKACVAALREYPQFNSSYDMNAGKLILKKYFHIGIAVDTPRGLVVPVIRDADKKSIRDIAAELAALAGKARDGKLTIDDMRGGTFTISNLGGIGGTAFTPIVNYPEVAILGLSRSSWQPVVRNGEIVPRLLMPLSLTYDHRIIDGADGCRFTVRLAQLFSDPLRLLMES